MNHEVHYFDNGTGHNDHDYYYNNNHCINDDEEEGIAMMSTLPSSSSSSSHTSNVTQGGNGDHGGGDSSVIRDPEQRNHTAHRLLFFLFAFFLCMHSTYYIIAFRLIPGQNVTDTNWVIAVFYWVYIWLCTSVSLCGTRPARSVIAILLGPITILRELSPASRTLFLTVLTSLIFYMLAVSYIHTGVLFTLLIQVAIFLIFSATWSITMMVQHTLVVIKAKESLFTPTAILMGTFLGPLSNTCKFRLTVMEYVMESESRALYETS